MEAKFKKKKMLEKTGKMENDKIITQFGQIFE